MPTVTLQHPSLGKHTVHVVFTPPAKEKSNLIVLSSKEAAMELKKAPEFYKQYANKISFYPNWELTLNDGVKIISR